MNLVYDALNGVIAGAEQRMNDAGVPRIVQERCFVCGGRGTRERTTSAGVQIDYCAACASRGYVLKEAA